VVVRWAGVPLCSDEPVSDIDTVVVDSLKAIDPERPIREADIALWFEMKDAANWGNPLKSDPYFCVSSPNRTTVATCTVDDDIKTTRDANRRWNLQRRSGIRNIPDCAFDLGRFVANDDVAGFEHAPASSNPLIFHGKLSRIGGDGMLIPFHQFQPPTKKETELENLHRVYKNRAAPFSTWVE
jgi:hypothetical protein